MVEAAVSAHNRWPNKRHIVHFMQPHYPFIGQRGKQIDHRGFNDESVSDDTEISNVWERLAKGELSREAVWEAYAENLNLVLEHVSELLKSIGGKVVITSDHGNLVGDLTYPIPVRGYDHPGGVYVKQLVKVPWHIIDQGPRREIESKPPNDTKSASDNMIQDRLEALGYR
jgi:hypothetical protein